ncbi:hypothetical protein KC853_00650 [Candidatus Saccharibacteria bacterium]|nr:hypothetical protein [Candidatus Saccharibacteria bacterium]MCB9834519.1 hypothetical protein [Candidatus Nomurabacteria bacterium]
MSDLTVHKAKTHLSKILHQVDQGKEFTIYRGDQPVALQTSIPKHKKNSVHPVYGKTQTVLLAPINS